MTGVHKAFDHVSYIDAGTKLKVKYIKATGPVSLEDIMLEAFTEPDTWSIEFIGLYRQEKYQTDSTMFGLKFTLGGKEAFAKVELANSSLDMLNHPRKEVERLLTDAIIYDFEVPKEHEDSIRFRCGVYFKSIENQESIDLNPPVKAAYSVGAVSIGQSGNTQNYAISSPNDPSVLSKKLPGMDYVTSCPEHGKCYLMVLENSLWNMVQHVNDHHKWTVDQIADWLDDLHDSGKVDLSFKLKDDDGTATTV